MSTESRIVFIVSDGTGITAENFSQSILAQFEASFKHIRIPFVDNSINPMMPLRALIKRQASMTYSQSFSLLW